MSEPVDIKIAHINKSENINDALNKEEVYEIFSKSNFEAIAPFYKFQQAWVNRAYETFKDFDTYLIFLLTVSFGISNDFEICIKLILSIAIFSWL